MEKIRIRDGKNFGSGINILDPQHWLTLKFFYGDPGSWMEKKSDPGWKKFGSGPVSAKQIGTVIKNTEDGVSRFC
jgi:hypothetical protein